MALQNVIKLALFLHLFLNIPQCNSFIARQRARHFWELSNNDMVNSTDTEKAKARTVSNLHLQAALAKNPAAVLQEHLKNMKDLNELKMRDKLLKIGLHPGLDSRMKRVLQKALTGQAINIVVIGGSNSAGGGMDKDNATLNKRYFVLLTEWWNNAVGAATGSFASLRPITVGGTGSYFFAFCYDTFLRDPAHIDIVIVEASVNYNSEGKAEPLEQLTRLLYTHQSQPAILFVDFVSGLGDNPKTKKPFNPSCTNLENIGQTRIANRYGVTSFVMKDFVCPIKHGKRVVTLSKEGYVGPDHRHVGERTHARIALMIISYISSVFNEVLSGRLPSPLIRPVPDPLFVKQGTKLLANPQCWSCITPDGDENFQRPSLHDRVSEKESFTFYHDGYDKAAKKPEALRKDRQRGWGNELGKSGSITFEIIVTPWNSSTSANKARSVIVVIHNLYNGAKGKVWFDDKKDDAIEIDPKARPGGSNELYTIANGVEPGAHTVTAETDGIQHPSGKPGLFVISGILTGPSGFSRSRVM